MKDATVKEEPKEEITQLEINEKLVEVLDRTNPVDGQAKADRQLANQEDNYRYHPDKVVVFEVSMAAIDKIDGTNGWHDIVTGSKESLEAGLSSTVEMTKENLVIADRFEVKMNRLPVDEWHCEYVIVDRKIWDESRVAAQGAMLGENEQFGDIMMRRGDA